MVCCILIWNSTWPQDHILHIECVNSLSLSIILYSLAAGHGTREAREHVEYEAREAREHAKHEASEAREHVEYEARRAREDVWHVI